MFVSIEVIRHHTIIKYEPDYNFPEKNLPEGTEDSPSRPPSLQERKPPYKLKTRLSPNWKPPVKNRVSSTLLTGYRIVSIFIGVIFLDFLTPSSGNNK